MKKTNKTGTGVKMAVVALIAAIVLTIMACGGGVSGTYYYSDGNDSSITFNGKEWNGTTSISRGSGTFTVSGKEITLVYSPSSIGGPYFVTLVGKNLTIVDANTITSSGSFFNGEWKKR